MERGRRRQGLVPDFLFQMPATVAGNPTGNSAGGRVATLGELKTITFCPSYMKPEVKKGVERRAAALPAEYTKKARDTDLDYCGTDPGTMGPVETHLKTRYPDILKLVIGPTSEISADFHELLHTMAESKIQHDARATGRQESDWAFASQICYLRRQVAITAVRGISDSLHTRLLQVGKSPGQRQAERRRDWAVYQAERGRQERAAHWILQTRGYRVLQRGQFLET